MEGFHMKRALCVLLLALLVAALVMAAGCGDSGSGDADQEETAGGGQVNGGDGEAANGMGALVVGTYQSDDGKVITLKADGTFESDAWDGAKNGTYLVSDDEMGKWVDLAFEDGSSISMSVIIADDQVAAILDQDTGTQYTRK
jgi:hypothetical protein